MSEDPIGFIGDINIYAFVFNNAINLYDPDGLKGKQVKNKPPRICQIPMIGPNSTLPTKVNKCASRSLIECIVDAESGGNPNAVSKKGATGRMQTTPSAIRELKAHHLYRDDMNDMDIGTTYINFLVSYCDSTKNSLAAYNAGYTVVNKVGGVPNYSETKGYISKIDKCLKKKQLKDGVDDAGTTVKCKCK